MIRITLTDGSGRNIGHVELENSVADRLANSMASLQASVELSGTIEINAEEAKLLELMLLPKSARVGHGCIATLPRDSVIVTETGAVYAKPDVRAGRCCGNCKHWTPKDSPSAEGVCQNLLETQAKHGRWGELMAVTLDCDVCTSWESKPTAEPAEAKP